MKKTILSLLPGLFTATVCFSQTAIDTSKMLAMGKERDQEAINRAMNGWWTESMRNHDLRLQWWRDARFGMFIHWGVYSTAGGEWKGKKVSGYAEHLMRKEKIPRSVYLDLAHQFNPVKFNAEEWVLTAKQAGMKYLVITSKHHDGFAMFPSAISDFNIRKQTPFQRDPMAELSAACKKYGLKFGFYYSHAFDWEHPDAPGNDWDYKNPGGDLNLFGGRDWYDLHPDLLAKARKYVDEKAIPQILELIRVYHPDILWFDTPQKLPLSENIRILEAIRGADSNVVVNGRLVRFSNSNFGDYKNTADRPAEFYPVTGDWEAIPTTNESYGYSKFDSSHKPVSHFIRLIASAASRGGNLLMNIGPKGDGSFDQKDRKILQGIGKWMDRNGEGIYGTGAGPLPYHGWGVSTVKNNKLYLHVFDWPRDGKLYVDGSVQIESGYFLSGPSVKIKIRKTPEGDNVLLLPLSAPDTVNTVIVCTWKKKGTAGPVHFITPNSLKERFLAFDALQSGKGFGYGDGKTDRYYVEGWKNKDQSLSWKFRTVGTSPARYKVIIKYLAPEESSGGAYFVTVDQNFSGTAEERYRSENTVTTTKGTSTVITRELENIQLAQGRYTLSVKPGSISKAELMKLLEIQLIPIK